MNLRTNWKNHTGVPGFFRRHLSVLAYLFLACVIAFSIAQSNSNNREARNNLRSAAVSIVIDSCERDNSTRAILRGRFDESVKLTKQYVKEGVLTEEQGKLSLKQIEEAKKALPAVNCKAEGEKFRRASLDK